MTRMNALEAFKDYLRETCADANEAYISEQTERFRQLLSARLK